MQISPCASEGHACPIRAKFTECFNVKANQAVLCHVFFCLKSGLHLQDDDRSFRCDHCVARTHNTKCTYQHATLRMYWWVKRFVQNVHFVPSPNMTALSYTKPAYLNSFGAQSNYKSENLCVPFYVLYWWFAERERGRLAVVGRDAKPYMCETYKPVALEKLSPFGCHV
jgi:hypothetical protein